MSLFLALLSGPLDRNRSMRCVYEKVECRAQCTGVYVSNECQDIYITSLIKVGDISIYLPFEIKIALNKNWFGVSLFIDCSVNTFFVPTQHIQIWSGSLDVILPHTTPSLAKIIPSTCHITQRSTRLCVTSVMSKTYIQKVTAQTFPHCYLTSNEASIMDSSKAIILFIT